MVQHDDRVQMQGRRKAGAAASGRRLARNVEAVSFQYDGGEEWYEEEGERAAGQGRNPYLEEYAGQYGRRTAGRENAGRWEDTAGRGNRTGQRRRQVEVPAASGRMASSHAARPAGGGRPRQGAPESRRPEPVNAPKPYRRQVSVNVPEPYRREEPVNAPDSYRRQVPARGPEPLRQTNSLRGGSTSYSHAVSRTAARVRRRKRVVMQRIVVCLWAVCIFLLASIFLLRDDKPSAAGNRQGGQVQSKMPEESGMTEKKSSSALIQGLPAEEFAKHPDWEEDFLTPNEYSRPGDPLESVKNIFVHYTANPGTSAKQNRSYFEQQKDVHQVSVSAHFIIGYEGEIIQCVPLDEVAYAVQTRNYDSISIECCHLEKDGSFTQETYASLIALLAWLTDVYDLDTEDILRHYDCGGKKCPLYYTENPDAWEQLKNDVDKL